MERGPEADAISNFGEDQQVVFVGVDEAGRGCLAGPVVAAAVHVPFDVPVISYVKDSKKMTEKAREKAYEEIVNDDRIKIGVACVEPPEIDEINILNATLKAMGVSISGVDGVKVALVDGDKSPAKFVEGDVNIKTVVKGDDTMYSIACASIVAKVTRDRLMKELHEKFPEYGFSSHKGYGTAVHVQALENHGPIPFVHRFSFEPVRVV